MATEINKFHSKKSRTRLDERNHNLAQRLVPTVAGMFRKDPDQVYRGEVAGISDTLREEMSGSGMQAFAQRLIGPMMESNWHFSPCGLADIPKSSGGFRYILASNGEDRIRQRAMYKIIGPLFEPMFHGCTFGFRPGVGSLDAIDFLKRLMREDRFDTLMLLDVKRCFQSIHIDTAMDQIGAVVGDKQMMRWIRDDLQTRPPKRLIDRLEREFKKRNNATSKDFAYLTHLRQNAVGIREGSPISPLVCNVYLLPIIRLIKEYLPGAGVVHYADNLALLIQRRSVSQIHRLKDTVNQQFKLVLELEHIIHREKDDLGKFLGYQVSWKNKEPYFIPPTQAILKLVGRVLEAWAAPFVSFNERCSSFKRAFSNLGYFKYCSMGPIYDALAHVLGDSDEAPDIIELAQALHERLVSKPCIKNDDFKSFWPFPEHVFLVGGCSDGIDGLCFGPVGDSHSLPLAVTPPCPSRNDQAGQADGLVVSTKYSLEKLPDGLPYSDYPPWDERCMSPPPCGFGL